MKALQFKKMHGLGNDFIVVDLRQGGERPPKAVIAAMADRKTGVGFDQILFICPPRSQESMAFLDMYNSDGSSLGACGNGTRCVADFLMRGHGRDKVVIETVAGLLACRKEPDGRVTVDMGMPRLGWKDIPLSEEKDTLHLEIGRGPAQDPVGINVGNPHAVFFVENADVFPVEVFGPGFETDPLFPDRANIEFVQVLAPDRLRMRVWERGAGITAACGSGACASLVAAVRRGLSKRKAKVILDGGELDIYWSEENGHIFMTGPVAYVFDGVYHFDE